MKFEIDGWKLLENAADLEEVIDLIVKEYPNISDYSEPPIDYPAFSRLNLARFDGEFEFHLEYLYPQTVAIMNEFLKR